MKFLQLVKNCKKSGCLSGLLALETWFHLERGSWKAKRSMVAHGRWSGGDGSTGQRQLDFLPGRVLGLALLAGMSASLWANDFEVVISEVNYHPSEAVPGTEAEEFVELQNTGTTSVDLTDWLLDGGVTFLFPSSVSIPPGGFVVVAQNAAHLESLYGITGVLGDFAGRLSNDGELLRLQNARGDIIDQVDYRDGAPWPENADGLGPSLEKIHPARNGEDQGSWRSSIYLGGSPGKENSTRVDPTAVSLIPVGATWKYKKGTAEPSSPTTLWTTAGFNDASWSSGSSGFGYADSDDATVLNDMENSYTTVYVRRKITVPTLSTLESLTLSIVYDDAYVAYLNGTEIGRSASAGGAPGTPLSHTATADDTHENIDGIDTIDLLSTVPLLKAGENTLAIQLLNENSGSSDASLIPAVSAVEKSISISNEPSHDVEINEVLAPAGADPGFIELHNEGAGSADISGWKLVVSPVGADGYVFAANTTLGSGQRLVVSTANLPFTVTDASQWIGLVTPDLRFVDGVSTRTRPAGRSWGRYPDGDGDTFVLDNPTPGAPNTWTQDTRVVINEVLYHPPAAAAGAEFIEIYNRSASPVDLSEWRFDKGVKLTFNGGTTLPVGGFLVVSGNPAAVMARYGIGGVLGPWSGTLSDAEDKLELKDALGNLADVVHYADDGRWPGSTTTTGPDGFGPSIELLNPNMENNAGAAWMASTGTGTPGAVNSRFVADPDPVVRSVAHSPTKPTSLDTVDITARASDAGGLSSVKVFSRVDGSGAFAEAALLDDGLHGDGLEGDGRYGATLPARPDKTVVQFYVEAADTTGHTTRFPATAPTVVCLYQVDNRVYPSGLPLYKSILRKVDLDELVTRPLSSNVLLDGTFIHGDQVTYNVGIRYRGEHSRSFGVKSFRVELQHDEDFEGLTKLDFNAQDNTPAQYAADLFRRAGMPVFQTKPASFTLNADWNGPHGGNFLRVEDEGNDFISRQFPLDDSGNFYRGVDAGGGNQGDFSYQGTTRSNYVPIYQKKTNEDLNDYSDIIALTNAFTNGTETAFPGAISALIDVDEWIRYFAIETIINNHDGCISTNVGEDYFIYRRPSDGKWVIIPWDQNEGFVRADDGIFRQSVDAIVRLLRHPTFEPRYYEALRSLLDGPFSAGVMDRQIEAWRFALPGAAVDLAASFVPARQATIRGLLPPPAAASFLRGDANGDSSVDISDAVAVLLYLFGGRPVLPCDDAADVDDSGAVAISDAIGLLNYLFKNGTAPRAPFPAAGTDPTTSDPMTCSP